MEIMMLAQAEGANPLFGFLPMLILLAVFYFLLILPQRRQQKEHQKMIAALKRGDLVVTAGGLIGEITGIKDEQIQLKSGQAVVVVERARIARLVGTPPAKE